VASASEAKISIALGGGISGIARQRVAAWQRTWLRSDRLRCRARCLRINGMHGVAALAHRAWRAMPAASQDITAARYRLNDVTARATRNARAAAP